MTLVEVMIAAGSASIVMLGTLFVYLACVKMSSAGYAQLGIQAKARQGLDRILYDVRKSASATIYDSYLGATNTDAGAYMVVQIPTNIVVSPDQPYHHYYVGNLKALSAGVTNGTLYFFRTADGITLPPTSTHEAIIRGVTNPDRVFDWINGVVNLNIRVADENDVDGKQIIYLRSAIAFRNK